MPVLIELHERLQNSEHGVAAVELGLMVAPIAVVVVVVSLPRTHLSTLFNHRRQQRLSRPAGASLGPPDPLQLSSAEPTPYSPDGGSGYGTTKRGVARRAHVPLAV